MKLQEELIKSANQIREKFKALKRGKFLDQEERLQTFQPLIEPLRALAKQKEEKEDKQIVSYKKSTPIISTPTRIPFLANLPAPRTLDFGILASEYLGNYLSKTGLTDTTYGIRRDDNKFYIGNKEVEIANDDISIGDKIFKGSKGLWELLTLKSPKDYTDKDLESYKEILEATNAHLKGYQQDAPISGNRHYKYTNIIKPLFKVGGSGVREVTNNKVDYIYWDDPNELVDRLRLLWLSRQAGNTGVNNEIDSIIEELRECGIIY